jgi:hypothetical protein
MKFKLMRKIMGTALIAAFCTIAVIPVQAAKGEVLPGENGTDVMAGIYIEDTDSDARVRVTVPTLFGFVVNGTKETTSTTALSSADGTILLPNVKVKVEDHTVSNGAYSLGYEGSGNMTFTNFSTRKKTTGETSASGRKGLEVSIVGSFENQGTAQSRNYWTHTADATGFKEFTLSVEGNVFNKRVSSSEFEMAAPVILAAPNVDAANSVDTTTQLAISGEEKILVFDVAVGGTRGQYNQVEESAKVGTIVWTVSHTIANDGTIVTSPSADPLAP